MDRNTVHQLREWAPLTILDKLPIRIVNGVFPADLNVTCVDVISEYIALGTDAGIIFWFNRINFDFQKLRVEVSSPITCIKIVSSVEYMVAAGTRNGHVNVFQIQKEIPTDLNLPAPLTKSKPIQRYIIRDLHKATIRCCEWSRNGMKLFSGDKNGVIVLTEFEYQLSLSKSAEIINEAYDIVQLSLYQSYLLVSTLYRTILCQRDKFNNGKWRILQVGNTDRKVLNEFGATFFVENFKQPKIVASRPGFRFWLADCNGIVEKTFTFKDAHMMRPVWEIPLLNPSRCIEKTLKNFTTVSIYLDKYFITNDDTSLYILNLEDLKIEAIARNFRQIIDFTICGTEIFVLEGGRSLIRLAPKPEPPSRRSTIIFNPLLPPPVPLMGTFESPIEYTEDENVINADECFELPSIEPIDLDIPIQTHLDSPVTEKNKLLEQNKQRLETFQKISELDFDDLILYRSERKLRNPNSPFVKKKKKKKVANSENSIVEIGQNANSMYEFDSGATTSTNQKSFDLETASPIVSELGMHSKDFNISADSLVFTEAQLINSSQNQNNLVEEKSNVPSPTASKIEKIKLVEISDVENNKSQENCESTIFHMPKWPTLNYPITAMNDVEVQTSPNKKLQFVDDVYECDSDQINDSLCKDINNLMIQSNQISSTTNKSSKTLQFIPTKPLELSPLSPDLGAREGQSENYEFPDHLKIPPLWNLKIETGGPDSSSESSDSQKSEWEFVAENNAVEE